MRILSHFYSGCVAVRLSAFYTLMHSKCISDALKQYLLINIDTGLMTSNGAWFKTEIWNGYVL